MSPDSTDRAGLPMQNGMAAEELRRIRRLLEWTVGIVATIAVVVALLVWVAPHYRAQQRRNDRLERQQQQIDRCVLRTGPCDF